MSALAAWDTVPESPRRPASRERHLSLVPDLPAAGGRPALLRITRSGRLVLTTLAVATVVLLSWAVTARAAATTPERVVTVRAGQTLSEVAAVELPGLPIAEGVARLQLANRLPSVQVRAGQELVVPPAG